MVKKITEKLIKLDDFLTIAICSSINLLFLGTCYQSFTVLKDHWISYVIVGI